MERLFKIDLTLVVQSKWSYLPSKEEVLSAVFEKLHDKKVPPVYTSDKSVLGGKDWGCVNINGSIEER